MYFSALRLREWKAFRRADFEFPKASKGKSVVLIGARNGFGKTSILEAIIIGLYGTKGRDLVARADNRDSETGRLPAYRAFIERAFNAQAFEAGESRMSVEIVIQNGRQTVTIERSWYVRNIDGEPKFKVTDEDLQVYEGREDDARPVPIPLGVERLEYLEAYIERNFLERTLAQFFLFDGERVQQLAQAELAAQVRIGIESLLGVGLLRTLEDDLERLVTSKRGRDDAAEASAATDELYAEIEDLRAAVAERTTELERLQADTEEAKRDRERLMREQTMLHGDGIRSASELNDKRLVHKRELDRCMDELAQIQERHLPLALVGTKIRAQLAERLTSESVLRQWSGVVQSGDALLDKLLTRLENDELGVVPRLQTEQKRALAQWVKGVWADLHYPPPTGCAKTQIHSYLNDDEVRAVLGRLAEVHQFASEAVEAVLVRMAVAQNELDRIKEQLARVSAVGGRTQEIQDKVEAAFARESEAKARAALLENELTAKSQTLANKEQALVRASELRTKQAPQLAVLKRASDIRKMLGDLIEEAVGLFTTKIGREMTLAYRGIAHKQIVREVRVASDCTVQLLTAAGKNFRHVDNSAGENQVFACALIAAVVAASGRNFPIVVDTPLARLDKAHRERLLAWLAGHTTSQVILLSTDSEVVDSNLDVVSDRVARTFLVEHEQITADHGLSTVTEDVYFQPVEGAQQGRRPGSLPRVEVAR
jgi:DNA sulfur modification protein DndD